MSEPTNNLSSSAETEPKPEPAAAPTAVATTSPPIAEPDKPATNVAKKLEKSAKKPSRLRLWLLIVFISIIAIGASAGCYWLWSELQTSQANVDQRLLELQQQLRILDDHPTVVELKQRVLDQEQQTVAALDRQQEQIQALEQAFITAQTALNRDQRGWILAEVEYLLRLANIRLRLMQDIKGATEALIVADQRLHDLADPTLLSMRDTLAADITQLKALAVPDIDGAALQLLSIANRIHLLPMAKRPAAERIASAAATSSSLEFDNDLGSDTDNLPLTDIEPEQELSFWQQQWESLKNTVGFSHSNTAPRTTAALQAELYYVEQLLRLDIEAARQAVMRFDQASFERRLADAKRVLDEHYDRSHPQVIQIISDITVLQNADLFPQLPDISATLLELQRLQNEYLPQQIIDTTTDDSESL